MPSRKRKLIHHHHSHSSHSAHGHSSNRIGWAFALNFSFTIIEFYGGWLTNSTAILADAIHDLGDTLAIGFAFILAKLAMQVADQRFTYGYQRLSLFAALINALVLIIGSIWILFAAVPRLFEPVMPDAKGMIGFAILGVLVNGFAAYKLSQGNTLNERVLNWHLIEDVLGWLAVLVVSVILLFWHMPILDPLLSIGFTVFILINVIKNLKTTLHLFLQAVPDQQMHQQIQQTLMTIPHVVEIHHLHLWSLDGEQHVLTAHLVLDISIEQKTQRNIKQQLEQKLAPFNLSHTTFEIEQLSEDCRDLSH